VPAGELLCHSAAMVPEASPGVTSWLDSANCGHMVYNLPTTERSRAEFFRAVSQMSLRLAAELDPPRSPAADPCTTVNLGFLQRWIAGCEGMYADAGMSPREVMEATGRTDEPNLRSSLDGMIRQGLVEHVPALRVPCGSGCCRRSASTGRLT
jgi:hypothetical protein